MILVADALFEGKLVQTADGTVLVGIGEAYHGNAARINNLAQYDPWLGVESVRAEGDNIVVTLRPGVTWTNARIKAIRNLFA